MHIQRLNDGALAALVILNETGDPVFALIFKLVFNHQNRKPRFPIAQEGVAF